MGLFGKKPTTWERKAGDIASRIEAADVKRIWLNRPFIVKDGTAAVMFSKGRLLGRVHSGEHDIDGILRRFFHGEDPTTLVIIDDGEFPLDGAVDGLYSREQIALKATLRLNLVLADPEVFYRNTMRDRRSYTITDLHSHLRPELHDALLAFTSVHAIEDLYNNPGLRQQAEDAMQERLGTNLAALGFALVNINVLGITSPAYDAHRANMASAAMSGREAGLEGERLAVLQRVREMKAGNTRHEATTDADLRDAVNQAIHELGLKDRLRADELQKLQETLAQDFVDFKRERERGREGAELEHTTDLDATRRDHERRQAALDLDAFLDARIREAKSAQDRRDLERSGEAKDWDLVKQKRDDALDAMARLKGIKTADFAARADILKNADTATKIALGAGDASALLELDRLDKQAKMSPDQLLVLAAEASPDVAAALAEKFRADGRMNEELMDQLRRQLDAERTMNREHAMQLERVLNQALGQMGNVASTRAAAHGPGHQTVVAPGGLGGPTVINPQVPGQSNQTPPAAPDAP
ncbi:MAG: hypothetical protein KDA21_11025 [Phycisphaerales bacterium]|nr:hypothetical protein [Phycisphaerales bacterium]